MLESKGPLAKLCFWWSFGFDIRMANRRLAASECQIHFTSCFTAQSQSEAAYSLAPEPNPSPILGLRHANFAVAK
jgi:hypothetical protein